jgi:hypothetical protein
MRSAWRRPFIHRLCLLRNVHCRGQRLNRLAATCIGHNESASTLVLSASIFQLFDGLLGNIRIGHFLRGFLEVLNGFSHARTDFWQFAGPKDDEHDDENDDQFGHPDSTDHDRAPFNINLASGLMATSQQLLNFLEELEKFLGLPILVQALLLFEPTSPDLHPGIVMPVILGLGLIACLSLLEFLVFLTTIAAERVRSALRGSPRGFHVQLGAALRAFQEAASTLKNLLQSVDLTLPDSLVAYRPQILRFFAKFNDLCHIIAFSFFFQIISYC